MPIEAELISKDVYNWKKFLSYASKARIILPGLVLQHKNCTACSALFPSQVGQNPTNHQNLVKQFLPCMGTNKTLCAWRPRRKEQSPHKTLSQTCLSVQESRVEVCVNSNLLGGKYTDCSILRDTSWWQTDFGLKPNYREGIQPHLSPENWLKDLLSMV